MKYFCYTGKKIGFRKPTYPHSAPQTVWSNSILMKTMLARLLSCSPLMFKDLIFFFQKLNTHVQFYFTLPSHFNPIYLSTRCLLNYFLPLKWWLLYHTFLQSRVHFPFYPMPDILIWDAVPQFCILVWIFVFNK